MKNLIEKSYFHSPIFLQNILCSLYGISLYRERYGGAWKQYYSNLLRSELYNGKELEKLQGELFKKLLIHACKYVPYYREEFGFDSEIKNERWQDLLLGLPLLNKSIVRSDSKRFISEFYSRSKLIRLNTSGTTGTPLTVFVTPKARKLNYAFFSRSKKWAGVEGMRVRSATFAGRTIVSPNQTKPPFWRKNMVVNNTLFSSYHLSDANLKFYVNRLIELQPVFIDSYPSSINAVADYCIENNITSIKPKAIITSAETLFDHQRNKIESAFGCPVFDQYGCTEQAVFVSQCRFGNYHVNPEYGLLEVVDKKGQVVPDGAIGEIVCTGFTNYAMPLIRYKIGDLGALSSKKCECGLHFPVLEKIVGRVDDVLITPDGRFIGRLDPVFKGVASSIKEAQIVQYVKNTITIKIVKDRRYKKEHGEFIVKELIKRMGEEVDFKIEFVTKIPRTKSGKFRAVVNNIRN